MVGCIIIQQPSFKSQVVSLHFFFAVQKFEKDSVDNSRCRLFWGVNFLQNASLLIVAYMCCSDASRDMTFPFRARWL